MMTIHIFDVNKNKKIIRNTIPSENTGKYQVVSTNKNANI